MVYTFLVLTVAGQPNHEYLMHHGFVLDDNPHDCVQIAVGIGSLPPRPSKEAQGKAADLEHTLKQTASREAALKVENEKMLEKLTALLQQQATRGLGLGSEFLLLVRPLERPSLSGLLCAACPINAFSSSSVDGHISVLFIMR